MNAMGEDTLQALYAQETRRSLSWRTGMDWTRNLSVLIVGGMAFVAFGLNGSSHLVLFLGSLSVFALLIFESRMHQFAQASEQRLSEIEKNYFAPAVDVGVSADPAWRERLAKSLLSTAPAVSFIEAFAARVSRNYFIIFLALDACWFSKLYLDPQPAASWTEFQHRADFGFVPGWMILLVVVPVWGSYVALIVWLRLKEKYLGREVRY